MKIEQRLHMSICEQLQSEIQDIKDFWMYEDSPAFIRIEGGHIRPHFISKARFGLPDETITPEREIEFLSVPEQQKEDMLATLNRMLPGTALILLDTDSEDVDSRTHVWFIA